MKKVLGLNIKDRLMINQLLPEQGSLIQQKLARDIIEKVKIGQKEMKKVGLKTTVDNKGRSSMTWNEKAKSKSIELSEMEYDLLKDQIDRLDKDNKITQDILPMCVKIKDLS